ncbi:Lipoxigenase, partial [Coccomyxa subellipsoidea C-169]
MSHLLAFLQPDETAAQLIARTNVDPVNTGLFFASVLRPGQVLEITGPSGAAKSEVLIQVAAARILPRNWKGEQLGGEENVVLFDLDRTLDTLRLYQVVAGRLRAAASNQHVGEDEVIATAERCLQRLHVVLCSSSFSFLASLRTCGPLLKQLQESGGMQLLLIDNVAAYYWLDRASQPLPACAFDPLRDGQTSLQQAHACIAAELQTLMRQHRLAVIATKQAVLSASSSAFDRTEAVDIWAHREFLPKAWQEIVTMRLLLRGPTITELGGIAPRPPFAVKWQMPYGDRIENFQISYPRGPINHSLKSRVILAAATWEIELKLHADYTGESIGKPDLEVTLVAADEVQANTIEVNTSAFKAKSWTLPHKVGGLDRKGVILTGQAPLPDGFGSPGALIVTKKPEDSEINRLYIEELRAWPHGTDPSSGVQFLANSWVHDAAPNRIFFNGSPTLPSQTPPGLQALRQKELQNLRGDPHDTSERKIPDRIYAYDVYNDLGGKDSATNAANRRPILGKARGGTLPYPRRLRTGRQPDKNNDEPAPKGTAWLPLDEYFSASKLDEFNGGTVYAVGAAASTVITQLFDAKPEITKFADFAAVDRIYARGTDKSPIPKEKQAIIDKIDDSPFEFSRDKLRDAFNNFPQDLRNIITSRLIESETKPGLVARVLDQFGIDNALKEKVEDFMGGLVATWPLPKVRDRRPRTWQSDEEVGRQAVAGCNPFTIQRADKEFLSITKITDTDVTGLLDGLTLEEAAAEGRLFWQNYYDVLADQVAPKVKDFAKGGHQYAGRGLFFKNKDTGALPIVAIELREPNTNDFRIFTPNNVRLEVWQLAKAVYSTLDAASHQLVSHFGETHAVMEPFAIATRRQLSAMHPVYQLILPHFRYTFNINSSARGNLINAKGVVESVFTPGPLSMELSARVYGDIWKFEEQSLPGDLIARGIAKREEGKLVLLLDDYPFAEDGLLVTDDVELTAWYKEAREEGHPDKKEGWIELTDTASLVEILATIAWIGSGHHAAVNFDQYMYYGYMPNKPSFVSHAIPLPDSPEEKALLDDFEFEFLRTLSDPIRAVQTMLLVKLLSNHSQDEEYLAGPENEWITDPKAVALRKKFEDAMAAAEQLMIKRNSDPESRARHSPAGVPYRLMYPSVQTDPPTPGNQGMTGCGIPYSVSI